MMPDKLVANMPVQNVAFSVICTAKRLIESLHNRGSFSLCYGLRWLFLSGNRASSNGPDFFN
jgi:hypothetical protein